MGWVFVYVTIISHTFSFTPNYYFIHVHNWGVSITPILLGHSDTTKRHFKWRKCVDTSFITAPSKRVLIFLSLVGN